MPSAAARLLGVIVGVSLTASATPRARAFDGNDLSLVPGAAPALNIRLHSGVSASLAQQIAKIGQPTSVTVAAGEDITPLVDAKCGHLRSKIYLVLAADANKSFAIDRSTFRSGVPGTLTLPACAYVEQDVSFTATADTDLVTLLTDATGYSGTNTLAAFRAQNPRFPRGETVVRAGQTVILPYRSRLTTIKLVPDPTTTPETQLAQVKRLLVRAMIADAAAVGRFVPAAARGAFQDAVASDCPALPPPLPGAKPRPWPFAADQFLVALTRVAGESEALKMQQPVVNVAILDSGFPSLPTGPFTDNRLVKRGGYTTFDRYGISAIMNAPPYAQVGDADADHGTMVATLALGGKTFLDLDTGGVSRIHLRLEQVSDPTSGGALYEGPIASGFKDAVRETPSIVNASFEFPSELTSLAQAMDSNPDILMVVAAGNDGRQPATSPRFPADYGGDRGTKRGRYLTVGASTQDGKLAPFSAYGSDYIDILAPGCDIPTLQLDLTLKTDLGTSLSAPIMTFLVASVRQLGLSDPRWLRERALMSADPKADLYDKAFAAGVVNPFKMIEIHHDYVEMKDGTTVKLGQVSWNWNGKLPVCVDTPYPPLDSDTFLKLGRLDGGNEWLLMWRTTSGDVRRCRTTVDKSVVFALNQGGADVPLPLTDVKDIVAASVDDEEIRAANGL